MATKNAVKVAPLADRVVVKPLEETEQMRGGLYIPDTAKEKPQQGEIVAAGPGRYEKDKRVPMELKVGDKVTFRYYESVLSQITKASDQAPAPAATEPKMVSGTGPKPSGIISQQFSARVTIKAIDPKSKSLTVALDDGRAMSLEVVDKKILRAVKVGDKVDVTYTAAFLITVQ